MSTRRRQLPPRAAAENARGGAAVSTGPDRRKRVSGLDPLQNAFQGLQPFGGLDVVQRYIGGVWFRLLLDRGVNRLDRAISRKGLIHSTSGFGVDAGLQFPAFAARRQLANEREHVIAILFMGAGQESEASVMLDDPVVVLGEAQFGQRVVERAARRNEERRDMQTTAALRRVLFRHDHSSRVNSFGKPLYLGGVPPPRDQK